MCPEEETKISTKNPHLSSGPTGAVAKDEDNKFGEQMSPMLQVISKSHGAQSFYGCIAAFFLLIILVKCILFIFSPEERMSIIQFYGSELIPVGYFWQLFVTHHLILYLLVFPTGKLVKNSFVVKISAIFNLVLFKLAIYHLVYIQEETSVTIRIASAVENVRVMMKSISYLIEANSLHHRKEKEDEQVTLYKFTYFLFAPTLLYQNSYAKTNKGINWRAFARFMAEFQVITIIWCLYIKDVLVPALDSHRKILRENPDEAMTSYIRMYIHHVAHSTLVFLWSAFAFLHSYCNATAELLCFADRTFYQDWWISGGSAEMLRKWNRIVGSWLFKYIYVFLLKKGVNRLWAMMCVLLLSGLYHDYIIAIVTRTWVPGFTILMLLSAGCYIITPYTSKLGYIWTGLLSSLMAYCSWGYISLFSFN